jgi:hypothetical protein
MLASMQQWMIGLGIMVAVSNDRIILGPKLTILAMDGIRVLPPRWNFLLALPTLFPSRPSSHPHLRRLVPPRITALAHRKGERS